LSFVVISEFWKHKQYCCMPSTFALRLTLLWNLLKTIDEYRAET